MKNMDLKKLAGKALSFGEKNSPAILTGLAVGGLFLTIRNAFKAAPLACDIINQAKRDLEDVKEGDKEAEKAVKKEATKKIIKVVLPTAISATATTACIIGSNAISSKRVALLSAAYNLSETAVKDLNGKMNEMLGERKTRSIKDAVIKDKVIKDGPQPENQIILTGDGDVLCKDSYTGRYFRSNAQKIGQAINTLSHDIQIEMYVCLNDLYELIKIPQVPMGNDLGWNVDDTDRGQIPIYISSCLTEEGVPCLVMDYDVSIRSDFKGLR